MIIEHDIVEKKYCPIIRPTELLGDTWTLLIIKELLEEPLRFNKIKDKIPEITNRTLSARLKKLVSNKVIERNLLEGSPPKVEYNLTQMGYGLKPVLREIEDFGNKFMC
ncbi:MAG: helix-turn-helix domain-containing protein [Patescibacteria group bacterium]